MLLAVLVAHLSVVDGAADIRAQRGREVAATRNAPVVSGDTLGTGASGFAEVQLDPNVALRLGGDTRVQVVALAYGARDVRLLAGSLAVSVLRSDDAPRIETPSVTLRPRTVGLYYADLSGGVVSVAVQRGKLLLDTPDGAQALAPGERVFAGGDAARPILRYAAPARDPDRDAENARRDAAMATALRDSHLPSSIGGYVNLASYGRWTTLAGYPNAWRPNEYAGWAPYHLGAWLWRDAIGWTWVARESWGWLPYHYGAWIHDAQHGWCWVPPRDRAASWSAANAAFFSTTSAGTQSIGWVPLSPGEGFARSLSGYRNAFVRGGIELMTFRDFRNSDYARVFSPRLSALRGRVVMRAPPAI